MLQALRTILPLALTSGINLYLTALVVGLSIRFEWVSNYPAGLAVLATVPALIIASILYAIEFVADKVPLVDSLWDLLHTIIRPVGAVLIATASLSGYDQDLVNTTAQMVGVNPRIQLFGAIIACIVALISHSGKAGTRTAINVSGGGVTFVGVLISLLEDAFVAFIAFLALKFPTAANIIAIILLILLALIVPQLIRWSWFAFKALLSRFKALVSGQRTPEALPEKHRVLLGDRPVALSVHCQSQGRRPLKGRYGYLSLTNDRLVFSYRRWFRSRVWELPLTTIQAANLRKGFLVRVLTINYVEQNRAEMIRFAFTVDRTALAEQISAALGIQMGQQMRQAERQMPIN